MDEEKPQSGEVISKAANPLVFDPTAPMVVADADGAIPWPVDPVALLLLYLSSPEHSRCVHLIAEGAFGGGLVDADGAPVEEFESLFEQGSAATFVELGIDQGTYGNAYLQKVMNRGTGRIVLLRRLPAIHMKKRHGGGFVQVIRNGFGQEARTFFSEDEIIHFRPPCPMGGFYSLPDWTAASGMMKLAIAATEWNAKFFENGAMPEYAVIVKGGQLTDKQKDAARAFFRREFHGLDNAHKTLLLEFGEDVDVEFKRVTAELKDGDFLKMLDASRDRVHMSHGVPPRLLGIVAAGQLGGGGEITGQLKMFEDLRLAAVRKRALGQLLPVLRPLKLAHLRFRPLDLTPADMDRTHVTDWAEAGLIDRDEARRLAGIGDEPALTAKSASSRLAVLAKMLADS